jgi:Tol biopolymer transport system component
MGRPTGDYWFAFMELAQPNGSEVRAELWAAPLDGSEPSLALAWLRPTGGIRIPDSTVVARQLSPDGRSFAFTGTDGLYLVDLVTGAIRGIATNADGPVWRPDGTRIAFTRWTSGSTATVWWIRPDGSGLEQLPGSGAALAWSPDGATLATGDGIYQGRTNGTRIAAWPDVPNGGAVPLSWRASSPQIALAANSSPDGVGQQIEVFDPAATPKIVTRESGSLTRSVFSDPRWHPTESKVLYLRRGSFGNELRIVDTQAGTQQVVRVSGTPKRGEWSPAGARVVYIATTDDHDELRFTARFDGSTSSDELLLRGSNRAGDQIKDVGCVTLR